MKQSLLVSASLSAMAVAAAVSLGYPSASKAFNATSLEPTSLETISLEAETAPQSLPAETPQALPQRSPLERLNSGIGNAAYTLEDAAIQFTYSPESFVLESFDGAISETKNSRSIALWTKADYLMIKNEAEELGDFPTKLGLEVFSNPDKMSVTDWLANSPNYPLKPEIENIQQANTAVAGQDAWTFSYQSLFEYEGIAFQGRDGQIILISAYKPSADSTSEGNEDYSTALSTMVESLKLVAPASE